MSCCPVAAGFFAGGIAGALAGKVSDSGIVRGAGLGAVAGAVLSVEILEASRELLHLGRPGSRRSSLMVSYYSLGYLFLFLSISCSLVHEFRPAKVQRCSSS